MKFAVLGTGAIATTYGVMLARAGHDVVVLGRAQAVHRLATSPARLSGIFDETRQLRAETVAEWLARDGSADLLLVCTKAIDTQGQLAPFAAARLGAAASFQNGLLKDRFLAEAVGAERIVTAETLLSAATQVDGSVVVVTKGCALLSGPADPEPLARILTAAGLPAEVTDDPAALLWSKAAMVAAGFGVGCLSRQPAQRLYTTPQLAELFLDLLEEIAALAAAQGISLRDFPGLPARTILGQSREANLRLLADLGARLAAAPAPLRVSMLQDLEAGKPLEVEEVLGGMVAEAARLGVATPCLSFCYGVLSGLEAVRSR